MSSESIDELARTYGPALKKFFWRQIYEKSEVDDLVQEVFLRLASRGDLNDVANVQGFIFQIAANILRDRSRRRVARHANDHEPLSEDYHEDTAFSPERVLIGREAMDRLEEALMELPEQTRRIFFLCRIEGMANVDVAARVHMSLSSVNKHLAKALTFLVNRMKDDI